MITGHDDIAYVLKLEADNEILREALNYCMDVLEGFWSVNGMDEEDEHAKWLAQEALSQKQKGGE